MTNIEQLKTQVPHLGCEKEKFSLEVIGPNVYKALVEGIHES